MAAFKVAAAAMMLRQKTVATAAGQPGAVRRMMTDYDDGPEKC
jgi:hypothetical protein